VAESAPVPPIHILVAVDNQDTHRNLLRDLACDLAGESGQVTLLCITPDGKEPDWIEAPELDCGPRMSVEIREGNDPGQGILRAAREIDPDLLLLAWSGEEGPRQYLLGSTLDQVIRYAPCNVAVVRGEAWPPVKKALVPAAGGPNAALSIELALRASPEATVTALNIAREATGPFGIAAGREHLTHILGPWEDDPRVKIRVRRAPEVVEGILAEAEDGYDLLLIGASNESYIDRKLFGNVPQTVAASASIPTIVVRRRAGPLKSLLRQTERVLSDIGDVITSEERVEAYREIRRGARPRLDFFMLIGFAAAIASLGLLMDSVAVIIGAMLIAPLMSAIFGVSLGIVQGDVRLLWQAAGTTLRGIGIAILVGAVIGLLVPLNGATGEMLANSQPTMLDLVVALVCGAAGAYAQCRRNAVGSLAGVGIAVSLVPPLATTGIGLTMGSGRIAGGAFLLFLANLSAITAASSFVLRLFGFRPDPGKRVRVFSRSMIGVLALLGIVFVLLVGLTVNTVLENQLSSKVQAALVLELGQIPGVELVDWQLTKMSGKGIALDVEARATGTVSHQQAVELEAHLAERLGRPVVLTLSVTQVTHLDPRVAPTPVSPSG
jgi:uncharacterized hydrophobic protein (TIGR00271 family)